MVGTEHPLAQILKHTAETLDITPELFQRIERTHQEVGHWLGDDESPLAPYNSAPLLAR